MMYDEVDDDRDGESNNNDYHDEVNDNRCRGTDKMIIDDGGNDDK